MSPSSSFDSQLLKLTASLAAAEGRQETAGRLAAYIGAQDIIVFVKDPATGVLLPAPGFPQTLPQGLEWRDFTAASLARGQHHGTLHFPTAQSTAAASGYAAGDTAVLVVLGGSPRPEAVSQLRSLLPILAFGFHHERAAGLCQIEAKLAREAAADAKKLAETVDLVRRQLDRQFEYTRAITDSLADAVFTLDTQAKVTFVNPAAERLLGWDASDLIGKPVAETICANVKLPSFWGTSALAHVVAGGTSTRVDREIFTRCAGAVFPARYTAAPIRTGGEVRGIVVVFSDLSEQDRTENQLRETQKLESIGLLAGGIAHDFNNLLTGILGNDSLLKEEIEPGHPWQELLSGIVNASERAADLTKQLLAYAGKGQFFVGAVNIGDLVRETAILMQATIPKSVDLQLEVADALPEVEGDRTQLQQLLMNLIINGAEAIGEDRNGIVRVTAEAAFPNDADLHDFTAPNSLKPGFYLSITVNDSGSGMDQATQARIFEPFFTTKFLGRGLGLAAALGIVRSHSGAIQVRSAPGAGSTFRVLLPARMPSVQPLLEERRRPGENGAVVLVIEDEGMVRLTINTALLRAGYNVVLTNDGSAGVHRFSAEPSLYDLVLLDIAMPVMGGEEAFRRIRAIRADIPVLLMSGYSGDDAARRFAGDRPAGFLQKPFTAAELIRKVEAVLKTPLR